MQQDNGYPQNHSRVCNLNDDCVNPGAPLVYTHSQIRHYKRGESWHDKHGGGSQEYSDTYLQRINELVAGSYDYFKCSFCEASYGIGPSDPPSPGSRKYLLRVWADPCTEIDF
jgi:hypothetical protein